MKHILLTFFLSLFVFAINAQNTQIDSYCCNPPGGANVCTDYFYDDAGNLEQIRNQDAGTNVDRTLFTVEDGEIVEERFQVWTGNWTNSTLVTRAFEDGNLVLLTNRTWNGSSWEGVDQTTFIYEDGELTQEVFRVFESGSFVNSSRVLYDGLETRTQTWNGSNWENSTLTIVVEEGGNVTEIIQREWTGSWTNVSRVLFEDFDGDTALTRRTQIWDGGWRNSVLESTSLTVDGEVDEFVVRTWNGSAWENVSLVKHVYEDGNLISITNRTWENGGWVNASREVLNYDDNNIHWQSLFQTSNGMGGWITDQNCREEYTLLQGGTDDDNDGIDNDVDNCPNTPNADQADNDNDGLGDVCDTDDDNDDVADANDNCPLTANADQADNDNDGLGDICDEDDDNDDVLDVDDNCPFDANPDQADTDGDGIGDVCDALSVSLSKYIKTFSIAPNPASENVSISIELNTADNYTLSMKNMLGVEVLKNNFNGKNYNLNMNVEAMDQGVYLIHLVNSKSEVLTKKILIF